MADEKSLNQAKTVFDTLCKTLEGHEWHYEKDVEKLCIKCSARGNDLPIDIRVTVDADRKLIVLLSQLPLSTPLDKRLELAAAVSIANYRLVDGSFDYNIRTGNIVFRMTSSFVESLVGSEVFSYMLFCSCATVDEYNDKFALLSSGVISIEEFISKITD